MQWLIDNVDARTPLAVPSHYRQRSTKGATLDLVLQKKPLTAFQEQFCHEYIKTSNASAAYRAVSPNSNGWTNNALWVTASKMVARPNVGLRIAQLREKSAERAVVSVQSIADELDKGIEQAYLSNQMSAYVTGVMGKAKLFGLLTNKKEPSPGLLDDLSHEELKILQEVLESIKQTVRAEPGAR